MRLLLGKWTERLSSYSYFDGEKKPDLQDAPLRHSKSAPVTSSFCLVNEESSNVDNTQLISSTQEPIKIEKSENDSDVLSDRKIFECSNDTFEVS